jgi:hypothetical protein
MILDGWEGNLWVLCLAACWFGWHSWLSKIRLSLSHFWARIDMSNQHDTRKPLLQNHPNPLDTPNTWFWMVGKGIYGFYSMSCSRLVWVALMIVKNSAQPILSHYWARMDMSNQHDTHKPLLQNHPNPLDTPNTWFWMVGKGIYGSYVLQQAGLGGADCQKFSSAYSIPLLSQNWHVQPTWHP